MRDKGRILNYFIYFCSFRSFRLSRSFWWFRFGRFVSLFRVLAGTCLIITVFRRYSEHCSITDWRQNIVNRWRKHDNSVSDCDSSLVDGNQKKSTLRCRTSVSASIASSLFALLKFVGPNLLLNQKDSDARYV